VNFYKRKLYSSDLNLQQQEPNQIQRELRTCLKVPAPKTAGEVRMANTCHEYIPDYATITAPLRELTKKNIAFKWKIDIRKHLSN
jgi:hypothetical protein